MGEDYKFPADWDKYRKIQKEQIITQCKRKLESTQLTYELAKKILEILSDEQSS